MGVYDDFSVKLVRSEPSTCIASLSLIAFVDFLIIKAFSFIIKFIELALETCFRSASLMTSRFERLFC